MNMPEMNVFLKPDWSIFETSGDISRFTLEALEKIKLLKNDLIFQQLVQTFLFNSKGTIEQENKQLILRQEELITLYEAAQDEKDEKVRKQKMKSYETQILLLNDQVNRFNMDVEIQNSAFDKYMRDRGEILEFIRTVIDEFHYNPYAVNADRVALIEMLYMLSSKKENPYLELPIRMVHEKVFKIFPDMLNFGKLNVDVHNQKDEEEFSIERLKEVVREGVARILTENDQDESHFDLIFSYTMRQTSVQKLYDLLDYQSEKFEGDFIEFLDLCLVEHSGLLLEKQLKVIQKWIEKKQQSSTSDPVKPKMNRLKKRIKQDDHTSLSKNQTVYAYHLLQKAEIILPVGSFLSKTGHAEALHAITGYNQESLRQRMSKPLENLKKRDLVVTKNIFESIIKLIDKDLEGLRY